MVFRKKENVYIVCTILTAAALYIIQIKYSKHKLKSDFRCNEIIHDVYDGIERTHELIKESKELSNEIELFKKEYPDYENMSEFLKLPVAQQNKISRKVQKKASKIYLKYRIRNFFK